MLIKKILVITKCEDCCHFSVRDGKDQYCFEADIIFKFSELNNIPYWCPLPNFIDPKNIRRE